MLVKRGPASALKYLHSHQTKTFEVLTWAEWYCGMRYNTLARRTLGKMFVLKKDWEFVL